MEEVLKKKFGNIIDYEAIIKEGKAFNDVDFPPNKASLGDQDDIKEIAKSGLTWKKPKDVFTDNIEIFKGIDISDILQGDLGDCYFLSAISGLAEFPNRIEKIFLTKTINSSGCYALQIFICGVPKTIVVNDFFPYLTTTRHWAFTHSRESEIWVMLIEKAWAKIHGSYGTSEGGDSREALSALTGAPTVLMMHSKVDKQELWRTIYDADRKKYIMTTGSEREVNGILKSHTYSLIKAVEVELGSGLKERLLQIRNPWGNYEWQGDWSDESPLWTPELRTQLRQVSNDDGFFYIKFDDFCSIFSHTFICKCTDHFLRTSTLLYEHEA